MNTKQAKDFLVLQVTEQATLEGVSLTEVERRMMYFTESDPSSCDDPVELHEAFEAGCETDAYEAKLPRLLQSAHERLRATHPETLLVWDEAIGKLRKGDHYILVLWDLAPANRGLIRRLLNLL